MNTNKERYRKWCETDKSIPFFYKYDYYQTVFGDDWNVVLATNDVDVLGFMPFVVRKKYIFKKISPELFFPYQGIWINFPPNQKYASKISFEMQVIKTIIEQMPQVDFFRQQFYPTFTNWLPFLWENYNQITKYTYIIKNISNLEQVFLNFSSKARGHIRKAEKTIHIEKTENIELIYEMNQKYFKEKKLTISITKKYLVSIFNYCKKNNCGELLIAKDEKGNVHASFFYFWDCFSAYGITSITDEKYKNKNAMSLLYWEAIKRASTKVNSFNFNGGNIPAIETFFRAFGGIQTPYFEISKTTHPLLKLLRY